MLLAAFAIVGRDPTERRGAGCDGINFTVPVKRDSAWHMGNFVKSALAYRRCKRDR